MNNQSIYKYKNDFNFINLENFFHNYYLKNNDDIINPNIKINFFSKKKIIFIIDFNFQTEIIDLCKMLRKDFQCFILTLKNNNSIKHFKNFDLITYNDKLIDLLKLLNYIKPTIICNIDDLDKFTLKISNILHIPYLLKVNKKDLKLEDKINYYSDSKDIVEHFKKKDINILYLDSLIQSETVKKKKILNNFFNNSLNLKYNKSNTRIVLISTSKKLEIICNDLFIVFTNLGYKPFIYNIFESKLNSNSKVYYEKSIDKNIIKDNLFNFIHKNRISKIFFPNFNIEDIDELLLLLKIMNLEIYGFTNINKVKIKKLDKYLYFNKIFTNNNQSCNILNSLLKKNNVFNINFGLFHPNISKLKLLTYNYNYFKFVVFINNENELKEHKNSTISIFQHLEKENKILNWQLHIYITNFNLNCQYLRNTRRIFFHKNICNFKEKTNILSQYDISIILNKNMDLSVLSYQSLNCYTPVLTLNCFPNNELIKEGENGWLIDCKMINNDKNEIVKKVEISNLIYLKKIVNILINKIKTIEVIKNFSKFDNNKFIENLHYHFNEGKKIELKKEIQNKNTDDDNDKIEKYINMKNILLDKLLNEINKLKDGNKKKERYNKIYKDIDENKKLNILTNELRKIYNNNSNEKLKNKNIYKKAKNILINILKKQQEFLFCTKKEKIRLNEEVNINISKYFKLKTENIKIFT